MDLSIKKLIAGFSGAALTVFAGVSSKWVSDNYNEALVTHVPVIDFNLSDIKGSSFIGSVVNVTFDDPKYGSVNASYNIGEIDDDRPSIRINYKNKEGAKIEISSSEEAVCISQEHRGLYGLTHHKYEVCRNNDTYELSGHYTYQFNIDPEQKEQKLYADDVPYWDRALFAAKGLIEQTSAVNFKKASVTNISNVIEQIVDENLDNQTLAQALTKRPCEFMSVAGRQYPSEASLLSLFVDQGYEPTIVTMKFNEHSLAVSYRVDNGSIIDLNAFYTGRINDLWFQYSLFEGSETLKLSHNGDPVKGNYFDVIYNSFEGSSVAEHQNFRKTKKALLAGDWSLSDDLFYKFSFEHGDESIGNHLTSMKQLVSQKVINFEARLKDMTLGHLEDHSSIFYPIPGAKVFIYNMSELDIRLIRGLYKVPEQIYQKAHKDIELQKKERRQRMKGAGATSTVWALKIG